MGRNRSQMEVVSLEPSGSLGEGLQVRERIVTSSGLVYDGN